jgi:3-methyladenine DNA glycosylase AlkD
MHTLIELRKELKRCASPVKAKLLARYFKTGPGEYAEGDKFLGVMVPDERRIAKQYWDLSRSDVLELLRSPWHEERMIALFMFTEQYRRGDAKTRKAVYDLYLKNTKHINNWDLVDLSAKYIVGAQIANGETNEKLLLKLAKSRSLWERRIAVLATFYPIGRGDARLALAVAEALVDDPHDLIHKAVGWMLREVGKRCSLAEEEAFLDRHAAMMSRTMLRYALEHFPSKRREYYMGRQRVIKSRWDKEAAYALKHGKSYKTAQELLKDIL